MHYSSKFKILWWVVSGTRYPAVQRSHLPEVRPARWLNQAYTSVSRKSIRIICSSLKNNNENGVRTSLAADTLLCGIKVNVWNTPISQHLSHLSGLNNPFSSTTSSTSSKVILPPSSVSKLLHDLTREHLSSGLRESAIKSSSTTGGMSSISSALLRLRSSGTKDRLPFRLTSKIFRNCRYNVVNS